MAHVLNEIFYQPDAPDVPALLFREGGRAELAPRSASRCRLAQPRFHVLASELFEVEIQLALQFVLHRLAVEQ
jgi:hypothetical protein